MKHQKRQEGVKEKVHAELPSDKGDGISTPDTTASSLPFSIRMDIDLMQWLLTMVAFVTRVYNLEYPRQVVFDELHYGRFVSMYVKRTFFFDTSPPLGKMILSLGAVAGGFNGDFNASQIGDAYSPGMPVWSMRLIPAVFGSLLVPVAYQLAVEMRLSRWTAALMASLVILDNAVLTQSRFILLEPLVLFFICLSLLSVVKFNKINKSAAYSCEWWSWLTLLAISMTFAVSIKYTAAFTCLLVLCIVGKELWHMLPDASLSDADLWRHLLARLAMLVVVPVAIYLLIFYAHLHILNNAGPHDDIMSSAFQSTLQGGLASITRGQPLHVAYGSQVTLRHASRPCWLHSHSGVYPVRYEDGRGSSHQQQVTCYNFKDVNNWWIVKHPSVNTLVVSDPVQAIKHGDIIQLIHGISSRALNSHDVAAPISPRHQEVSCYIDYNISIPAQNLWRVDIANRETDSETWQTIKSQVRLVHVNTSQAVKITGQQLPEWGFNQLEVATDSILVQEATEWNVEEHGYTRIHDDDEQRLNRLTMDEMIPLHPVNLNFFSKFIELQIKMLTTWSDTVRGHQYNSHPYDWPLLDTNVVYWVHSQSQAQISLLGNPVIWYSASIAVVIYATLLVFYLLRRRRLCYDIDTDLWQQFSDTGLLLAGGYLLHFLPFLLIPHSLFLHSYLPALLYQILLLAAVVEHLYHLLRWWQAVQHVYLMLSFVWLTSIVTTFYIFVPLCYGITSLTSQQLQDLLWNEAWHFFVR